MKSLDAARAYLAVRANGWAHGDALKTAGMVFSSGGFGGLSGLASNYWPNTFRKLDDPWELRAGGSQNLGLDAFWRNATVQACLAWTQRTFTEARMRVVEGEGEALEEITDHRYSRLIANPNPGYGEANLWHRTLADWWIWGRGNAYWQKIRDRSGTPVQLWHIPATEIEPHWPKDNPSVWIDYYERRSGQGEPLKIPPRDIVHFRFGYDPQNQRKGYSPLLAAASEVGVLNEGAAYRLTLMLQHGVPSYALTPRDDEVARGMDPEKVAQLDLLFKTKFSGRGRGSLFIPNFLADLTRVGFSPQELDIIGMLPWDSDTLCALFGLSSMVVNLPAGQEARTYANQSDAREAALESNIIPTQALFASDLNRQLKPDFDPDEGHRVGWDYSQVRVLQDDQDKLYERISKAVGGPFLVPDEGRKKVGLADPAPDGTGAKLYPPKGGSPFGGGFGGGADEVPPESSGDLTANGANGKKPAGVSR